MFTTTHLRLQALQINLGIQNALRKILSQQINAIKNAVIME